MLSIIVLLASLALLPTAVIAQSTVKCAGNPYSYAPMTEASSTGTFQFPCGESTYAQSTVKCGGDKEQFCGRYNLKGKSYEEQDKMYKEDFKGGCLDMTTCPDDVKDDERTECERFIAESNEPGKCYAVCTIGFSKVGHDSLKDQNKCTDDEKKQYDEVTEKNEAAYKASLSSGSAVAPTLAAVTTAAIVVFAALY